MDRCTDPYARQLEDEDHASGRGKLLVAGILFPFLAYAACLFAQGGEKDSGPFSILIIPCLRGILEGFFKNFTPELANPEVRHIR